jgi:hypothetical protein
MSAAFRLYGVVTDLLSSVSGGAEDQSRLTKVGSRNVNDSGRAQTSNDGRVQSCRPCAPAKGAPDEGEAEAGEEKVVSSCSDSYPDPAVRDFSGAGSAVSFATGFFGGFPASIRARHSKQTGVDFM